MYKITSIILLLLILFNSNTFSQGKRKSFYGKKGGAAPTWFIGGGVLAGDMTGLSFYGPAVEISRKMPVIKLGSYMNFSLDPNITAGYGWYSSYTQSGTTQSALVSCAFNFNALAGAYNPVKKIDFWYSRRFIPWSRGYGKSCTINYS